MTNGKPRRRSVFSGLLLILVGVVLLMQNLRGDMRFLYLLHDWWPLLFILWGVAKLYDTLMARRTGQSPPRTVTGGEIFLVFLIVAVVGSVYAGKVLPGHIDIDDSGWEWFGSTSYSFNEDIPAKTVAADARISIRTDSGDISIHAEDTAEIRVLVKKTVHAGDEGDAQKRAKQVNVVVRDAGGGYEVTTENQGGRISVDLEVHVPKQATITMETSRGAIQVSGIQGNVTVETRRGDVEVRDSGGDVSAQVTNGDVHIVGAKGNVKLSGRGGQVEIADVKGEAAIQGEFFGPIRVEKVTKGTHFVSRRTDLTISGPTGRMQTDPGRWEISDVQGNLTMVTSKNDLVLENISGRVRVDDHDGNIELRFPQAPKDSIDVVNRSGNIEITVPARASFEIQATSRSGEIDSDFEELHRQEKGVGNNSTLSAKIGTKGPTINLQTSYGTIRLRKGQ